MRLPKRRALRGYTPESVRRVGNAIQEVFERRKRALLSEIEALEMELKTKSALNGVKEQNLVQLKREMVRELEGNDRELEKCWFGLQPKAVHNFLRKQHQLQEIELTRLEEQKAALQQKLSEMTSRQRLEEATERAVQFVPSDSMMETKAEIRIEMNTKEVESSVLANQIEQASVKGRGFWGDIARYVTFEQSEYEFLQDDNQESVFQYEQPDDSSSKSASASEELAAAAEQIASPEQTSNRPSLESSVLSEEIRAIRYKYIVGKLAGEDLVNSRGEVIIARNALITPKVIDKADEEGKLADLIVHMMIPGLGGG